MGLFLWLQIVALSAAWSADAPKAPCVEQKMNEIITAGNFEQNRTFKAVLQHIYSLGNSLKALAPESIVLDLGAGRGATVGSIFLDTQFRGNRQGVDLGAMWPEDREPYQHLKFLGITATAPEEMVVPLTDPQKRYKLLAGRFFEDISNSEIRQSLKGKIAVAYDDYGVFAYTATPDLALKKVYELLPVGGKLIIYYDGVGSTYSFETPDGRSILGPAPMTGEYNQEFKKYVALCGGFREVEFSAKWTGGAYVFEKTDQPFHMHRLQLKSVDLLGRPPYRRTFILLDPIH